MTATRPHAALLALCALCVAPTLAAKEAPEMVEGVELTWYGHASVKAKAAGKVVYFDPWKLPADKLEPADLILITHPHGDHCSPADVKRLVKPGTKIVTVKDAAGKLSGDVVVVGPGNTVEAAGVKVEAVPAYNLGKKFHPRENGWVGLIVDIGGKRVYHAGDTDSIPEMSKVKCDIALLPCGGKYTMDAKEAAEAGGGIQTKVVIPVHYGDIVGTAADAKRLKELCKREAKILKSAR